MIVQHNLTAMNSNRMLGLTTSAQAKSSEKLSSGYKINRAADDAAGLTISEKMRRQIRGLTQASLNAQDGISCVQTAEGALTEVHDMLQRMDELATKAANGTMSEDDRQAIQDEIDQLIKEIDRVSETTNFNEMDLLKGNTATKEFTFSYAATPAGIAAADGVTLYNADGTEATAADLAAYDDIGAAVASGDFYSSVKGDNQDTGVTNTGTPQTGKYDDILDISDGTTVKYKGDARLYDASGNEISEANLSNYFQVLGGNLRYADNAATAGSIYLSLAGDTAAADSDFKNVAAGTAKLYDANGNEIAEDKLADLFDEDGNLKGDAMVYADANQTTQVTAADIEDYVVSKEKIGSLEFKLHVGAESDEANKISVTIDAMSAEGIGINVLSSDYEDENGQKGKGVMDQDSATAAIDTIKAAITQVSRQRSALGAVQNRLEHTINNLDNIVENTTAAEAQIRDTDIATEMVKYANNNILQQAGTSMLSQANQTNQLALSLLG